MTILEKIIATKRSEVEERKSLYPEKLLEQSTWYDAQPVSLKAYLRRPDKAGIIAEIKRKSPSAGTLHASVDVEQLSIGYMQAGASALSVLTDKTYFGGSEKDLTTAREFNFCPILRKDFILDSYQITEAKSIGADAILLIAACLTKEDIKAFTARAHELGMEVILEVHSAEELERSFLPEVDIVGVNNRNLQTMQTDVQTSYALSDLIPGDKIKISESGIRDPKTLVELKHAGYNGFLIGEQFMKQSDPHLACSAFIKEVLRSTQLKP